jgi:hypothetical protein
MDCPWAGPKRAFELRSKGRTNASVPTLPVSPHTTITETVTYRGSCWWSNVFLRCYTKQFASAFFHLL